MKVTTDFIYASHYLKANRLKVLRYTYVAVRISLSYLTLQWNCRMTSHESQLTKTRSYLIHTFVSVNIKLKVFLYLRTFH
jgi:hypothetical protein